MWTQAVGVTMVLSQDCPHTGSMHVQRAETWHLPQWGFSEVSFLQALPISFALSSASPVIHDLSLLLRSILGRVERLMQIPNSQVQFCLFPSQSNSKGEAGKIQFRRSLFVCPAREWPREHCFCKGWRLCWEQGIWWGTENCFPWDLIWN